ncbi:MAG: ABC transporter substrate-binding protein [Ignavibacteria bacterium]|jgi:ABC-type glycerol-3-phosphate transport system substrate-binding protein
MLRKITILAFLSFLCLGCGNHSQTSITLQFLHFWTEPKQQALIDSLVTAFEQRYPHIKIEQIPVQWSEGRTKLLLSHSSGNPPDITHLGIEWAQEFIDNNVFAPISLDKQRIPQQFFLPITGNDGKLYCKPWTMNTRALIFSHNLSTLDTIDLGWNDIIERLNASTIIGINSAEPHNVSKKLLPIIWSTGSTLFQTLPLSATCDSQLIEGLHLVRKLTKHARIEQSRKLDDYVVNGTIQAVITGQWILPRLTNIPHLIVSSIPGKCGASILSGDCLGVSASSRYPEEAALFVSFITDYDKVKNMCLTLQDIGLPADLQSWTDMDFQANRDIAQFTKQTRISKILPSPPYFLDAERILEEQLMIFIYGNANEYELLNSLKSQLLTLEKSKKKGS